MQNIDATNATRTSPPSPEAARVAAIEALKRLRELVIAMAGTRTGGSPRPKRKRAAK